MPLRRIPCRLTIDFVAEVDSITEDAAHDFAAESGEPGAAGAPETWAWIGMQRRLLHALVSRPDLLRQYAEAEAQAVVSEEAGGWVHDEFGYRSNDGDFDAVWEAIGDLDEADRLAFVQSAQANALGEDADLVWRSFRYTPTGVRLEVDGKEV